jgi:ArsR family metal-binding transcriptional regulator
MFHALVLADMNAFARARSVIGHTGVPVELLDPPDFCSGLVAPVVLTGTGGAFLASELRRYGVGVSGMFLHRPSGREVPSGNAPDARWRDALGHVRVTLARPSVSDPLKLRVEIVPDQGLGKLIPIMARLIRGGAFRPEVPLLAFEEEHRLLTVSPEKIVICRADDMLDVWVMLRCMIELTLSAWDRRDLLKPEKNPRQGVGAIEIFRRLPGRNCGRCGTRNCMEFAVALFTGRRTATQCVSLSEQSDPACWDALLWFLEIAGINAGGSAHIAAPVTEPAPERGMPPGAPHGASAAEAPGLGK